MDFLKALFDWLKEHFNFWGASDATLAFLAALLPALAGVAVALYNWDITRRRNKIFDDSFFTPDIVKDAKRFYVRPKASIQAPKSISPIDINDVVKYLERTVFKQHNKDKFFLLLADSGMGKTTLLINLVSRSIRYSVFARYKIAVLPIKGIDLKQKIDELKTQDARSTILLLDALDEDYAARKDKHARLDELAEWTAGFRKVIITSRTQFFDSEQDIKLDINVFREGGYYEYTVIRLKPFDEYQVRRYVSNRFSVFKVWQGRNFMRRRVARYIVLQIPDVTSRPLMLSFIDYLLPNVYVNELYKYLLLKDISSSKPIRNKSFVKIYHAQLDDRYSAVLDQIPSLSVVTSYKIILQRWIERETQKIVPAQRASYADKLYFIGMTAAKLIFFENEFTNTLSVQKHKVYEAADNMNLELDQVNIASRSILFRNEDGHFVFAHKSILEYFLATVSLYNYEILDRLKQEEGWDNYSYFSTELSMSLIIDPLFRRAAELNAMEVCLDEEDEFISLSGKNFQEQEITFRYEDVSRIRFTAPLGYFDFRVFFTLKNLGVETYVNILEYYTFTLRLEFNQSISRLIKHITFNLDKLYVDKDSLLVFIDVLYHYELYERIVDLNNTYDCSYYQSIHTTRGKYFWDSFLKLGEFDLFKQKAVELYLDKNKVTALRSFLLVMDFGRYDWEIIATFEEKRESFALDITVLSLVAKSYYQIKNIAKAKYYANWCLLIEENNVAMITLLLKIHLHENTFDEAKIFLNIYKNQGIYPYLLCQFAGLIQTKGDNEKALEIALLAGQHAFSFQLKMNVADVLYGLGENRRAITFLMQVPIKKKVVAIDLLALKTTLKELTEPAEDDLESTDLITNERSGNITISQISGLAKRIILYHEPQEHNKTITSFFEFIKLTDENFTLDELPIIAAFAYKSHYFDIAFTAYRKLLNVDFNANLIERMIDSIIKGNLSDKAPIMKVLLDEYRFKLRDNQVYKNAMESLNNYLANKPTTAVDLHDYWTSKSEIDYHQLSKAPCFYT